jgi:hypothetical protein
MPGKNWSVSLNPLVLSVFSAILGADESDKPISEPRLCRALRDLRQDTLTL